MIALLLLLAPIIIFLASLPLSRKLHVKLRYCYWLLGAIIVFAGAALSFYFAAYSGDQGGVTAFFFQLLVIALFTLLSLSVTVINWLLQRRQ